MNTQTAITCRRITIKSSKQRLRCHNNQTIIAHIWNNCHISDYDAMCFWVCVRWERVRVPQQNTTEGHGNWWVTFRVFLWRPADALGFASEPPPSVLGACPLYRNKCDTAAGKTVFCAHGESTVKNCLLMSLCFLSSATLPWKNDHFKVIMQIKTEI